MVERTMIRPPSSRMGPITAEEREKIVKNSPVYGNYEQAEDRESAYELLMKKAAEREAAKQAEIQQKEAEKQAKIEAKEAAKESVTDRFVKNMVSSVGRQMGGAVARQISGALIRGILGGLTRR
jgi:uncharacterized protein